MQAVEETTRNDEDLIREQKEKGLFEDRLIVDSKRELQKQRYFGYLMLGVVVLYVLYTVVGLAANAFLPFNGLHKYALCALMLDVETIGAAGFTLVYFSHFPGNPTAKNSAIITSVSLGICLAVNIGLIVAMARSPLDSLLIAATIFALLCIGGGSLLSLTYYFALMNQERYAVVLVDKGVVYRLKADLGKYPIAGSEPPPSNYGLSILKHESDA